MEIPPLRDRREDLELLIRVFLDRIGRERGRSLRLAPSASRALLTYKWPGNVRELQDALEYATTVCEGQTIHIKDLPSEVGRYGGERMVPAHAPGVPVSPASETASPMTELPVARRSLAERGLSPTEMSEAENILAELESARFHRGLAAERLGMSRTTLWRKMKQYRL